MRVRRYAGTPSRSCVTILPHAAWSPAPELWTLETGVGSRRRDLVLVRQRPGSAKGVMFITLEDETGIAQLGGLAAGV